MGCTPRARIFVFRTSGMHALVALFTLFSLVSLVRTDAAALTRVRDLISSSMPSASANHTIQFTATSGVPASGSITITPQAGMFGIPAGFDYVDVDVSVSAGGPYTNRLLAATASASEDGVSVVTGSSGSILITLSSTDSISVGESVRITLGTDAVSGGAGDSQIANPATPGSYRVSLSTRSGSTALDGAQAMIAIVTPVQTLLENENTAPILSNGLPSGTIAAGNSVIELSLETTEPATCRYSTTPGVIYSAMTGSFRSINGQLFYAAVSGHVNNTSYAYYIRCADMLGVVNTSDYEITFALDVTPISNTSIVQTSTSGSGGVGPFPDGSSVLYLSSVTLRGWSSPQSKVYVLKDGTQEGWGQAGSDGAFTSMAPRLERGSYTFLAYAVDTKERKSATFSTTFTLGQGSNNNISDIVVPPTIELSAATIAVGESVTISGESVPGSTIELFLARTGSTPKKFTTTVGEGAWEFVIDAGDLPRGTYGLRARTIRSERSASEFTGTLFLGVGESLGVGAGSSDLNADGKVNLVDFSIMLSFWGTAEPAADINTDGTVNLADFSILLFNWTG